MRPRLDNGRRNLVGTLTAPAHTRTAQDITLEPNVEHIVLLEGIFTPQEILDGIDTILHKAAGVAHILHRQQLLRITLMLMRKGGIIDLIYIAIVYHKILATAIYLNCITKTAGATLGQFELY